jgi:hypothetical protein
MADVNLRQFREFKMTTAEAVNCYDADLWTLQPCTPKQRSFVYGLLDQTDMRLEDFSIKDLHDLTKAEVSELIDELKEIKESKYEDRRRY